MGYSSALIDKELRNTSRDVQRLIGNLSDRLNPADGEHNCEYDEVATSEHFLLFFVSGYSLH